MGEPAGTSQAAPAAELLFDADTIARRVGELGAELSADYRGRFPVFVAVLRGSSVFLADLLRATPIQVEVDFMSISAYGPGGDSGGRVRILKDLDGDIGGRDVVVIEDIVDTGLTASYLVSQLRSRSPSSVEVCTLLDKSVRRIAPLPVRYAGFDCPDRFVVGYGLDFEQRYRNLPAIYAIDPASTQGDPDAFEGLLS
jgi:hypoxanthine phosphoribosyltransferase